jgi:prepilin-type N-terminal cleavage/methylation domain-containing protein
MISKLSERFSQNHAPAGRGSVFTLNKLKGKSNACLPAGRGFSLIELLVVIAIIGILSTIVLASLSGARKRGRDSRRIADISQLKLALELYYEANQTYPTSLPLLITPGYIPAIPKDPLTSNDYAYVGLKGAAISAATCASYHLGAKMEIDTTAAGGSAFNDDKDGTVGGSYGTAREDGPVCNGSAWAGSTEIPQSSNDFSGADSPDLIYDMRP